MANYMDEARVEELWHLIGDKYDPLFGRVQVVTGSYVGTGEVTDRTITVGFKPKAAIIAANNYGIFASGGQGAANVGGVAVWVEGITKINTGGYISSTLGNDEVGFAQTETGLVLSHLCAGRSLNTSEETYYYAIFG